MAKSAYIIARVTPDEKLAFEQQAEAEGLSASDLLRALVDEYMGAEENNG